jgi:C1A family cysteine protease
LGWVRDFPDPRDFNIDHDNVKPFLLKCKELGDAEGRTLLAKYDIDDVIDLPLIRDQGKIGSCTSHAAAYMYETYLRVANLSKETLSRRFLYKVTRDLLGWKGDTGAYLRTVMQALATFGVPPEKYCGYDISRYDEEPGAFLYAIAQNYQAVTYYRLDGGTISAENALNSIKLNISSNRACMFGFTVYFNMDASGNVSLPDKSSGVRGGHAVCAIGFDDTYRIGTSVGAVKFANSWTPNWGHNGFGYLPYDYFRKGLASDVWTMMKGEWLSYECFK